MKRKALITGAGGQDAYYLAHLLAAKGYEIHLQSRRQAPPYALPSDAHWHVVRLGDRGPLEALLKLIRPHEIYNLASVSQPQLSWLDPSETVEINAGVPLRILQAMSTSHPECRICQSTSCEIFGSPAADPQNESTPVRPQNPYAIAKASAHWSIEAYRSRYGLFACSAVLFHHESPRRALHYVTAKIAISAALLALGRSSATETDELGRPILVDGCLRLGNLAVSRDFGYAGDYVTAMWSMLQAEAADDFVIGTGQTHTIAGVCEAAFAHVGLNWRDHVVSDASLVRRADPVLTRADSSKARARLGWQPTLAFTDLMGMMVDAQIERLQARGKSSVSA